MVASISRREGPAIQNKRKVNSLIIAHLAGVSQPTVSRALRGSKRISESTRQRVLQIANELNYKVDKHASSMRSHSNGTLALLIFEDGTLSDMAAFSTLVGNASLVRLRKWY